MNVFHWHGSQGLSEAVAQKILGPTAMFSESRMKKMFGGKGIIKPTIVHDPYILEWCARENKLAGEKWKLFCRIDVSSRQIRERFQNDFCLSSIWEIQNQILDHVPLQPEYIL